MKHSTPNKAKFKKLRRRLGMSLKETVGLLDLLWFATIENAMQGDIGRLDNETIAIECDYDGCPDLLVKTLVDCGWMDRCEVHRLVIHDWEGNAPNFVVANLKSRGLQFAKAVCREQVAEEPPAKASRSKHPATKHNITTPNVTQRNQTKTTCPEPAAPERGPAVSEFTFDVKGKPKTWPLPQAKLDEWTETFEPGISVRDELVKARQWCSDNPAKRKTARGMTAFLGRWLTRQNDLGTKAAQSDAANAHKQRLAEVARRREERERKEAAELSRSEADRTKEAGRRKGERTGGTNRMGDLIESRFEVAKDERSDEQARNDLDRALGKIE